MTCITTSVELDQAAHPDFAFEIDPEAQAPMIVPLPVYRCIPCLTSTTYTRHLVVESANPVFGTPSQGTLPTFIVPVDANGEIEVSITNPWDTGEYFLRVIATERAGDVFNDEVIFKLTLKCTITRFYNLAKGVSNRITYKIPFDLNSQPFSSTMPVYETHPSYCMLLAPQTSIVAINTTMPDFIKIDETVNPNLLTIFENDPRIAGSYNFVIKAIEPRFGFIDQSVKFEVILDC